jgi:hypothetical protein
VTPAVESGNVAAQLVQVLACASGVQGGVHVFLRLARCNPAAALSCPAGWSRLGESNPDLRISRSGAGENSYAI